jgi:multimeric flavodoxin WrbA
MIDKIVVIVGTNHEGSYTNSVVEKFFEHSLWQNYNITILCLKDYKINYCIGCEKCFSDGLCPLDNTDDFLKIHTLLEQADIIGFASPVYAHSVPGIMKSLIDRLSHDFHLMTFAGKIGFTITTTINSGHKIVQDYLKKIQEQLGIINLANYCFFNTKKVPPQITNYSNDLLFKIKKSCGYLSFFHTNLFYFYQNYYSMLSEKYNGKNFSQTYEIKYWSQSWVKNCKSFSEYAWNRRIHSGLVNVPNYLSNKKLSFQLTNNKNELVSTAQIEKISNLTKSYFMAYEKGLIDERYIPDLLLYSTELYSFYDNKKYLEDLGYHLCYLIKEKIETVNIDDFPIGMIGGLGYEAFLVNNYFDTTGNLETFSRSINKLLLEQVDKYIKSVNNKKFVETKDYDLIGGVSGILYYLLDFTWNIEEQENLKRGINYLIDLTEPIIYKDYNINKFFILNRDTDNHKNKSFPLGRLNFGLSHGMLGPLITLSKAFSYGYRLNGLQIAIERLFKVYERFKKYQSLVPIWPTELSLMDYITGSFTKDVRPVRASWCYGNIAISRGLEKAAKYMKEESRKRVFEKDLFEIINQPIEKYNLEYPFLCHGYSSVLTILILFYRENKNHLLFKKINNLVNIILASNYLEIKKSPTEIFKQNLSFLQGNIGCLLTLNEISSEMNYPKLLMVD